MLYHLLISLPFILCLFWSIFFFVRWISGTDEPRVKTTILLFYLTAMVLYLDHWLYFSGLESVAGEWSYTIVNLCVYPFYFAYLRALTRTPKNWEVPVLFLPPVAAALLFPLSRFMCLMSNESLLLFTRICFAMQVVWVLLRGYQLIHHTIRRMDDIYSDDRSRLLRPMHIWIIIFAATALASMILNICGRNYFTDETFVLIPAVVMSVLLYGLGYIAAHTTIPSETVEYSDHADAIEQEEQNDLIHRIDAVMREQMLYTQPGLTIYDLAKATNSNRTYVSAAINRTYGISFSQYVSRQRVEYAKLILRDKRYTSGKAAVNDAITLSGFASDQTFYRVFKEQTSLTPLAYRKSQIS